MFFFFLQTSKIWLISQKPIVSLTSAFLNFQAIRDGVIDATIDHEKGHVQSKVLLEHGVLCIH